MDKQGRGGIVSMYRGEYSGAFLLLILGILFSLVPRLFYQYSSPEHVIFTGDSLQVAKFEKGWHVRRGNKFSKEFNKKLSIYKVKKEDLLKAGISAEAADKIVGLGKEKYKVHSFSQLAAVIGCDSALLIKVLWPWWENQTEDPFEDNFESRPKYVKKEVEAVSINLCDTNALIALPGIGSKTANRIINYRNKLGGFYSFSQIKETFGVDTNKLNTLQDKFIIEVSEIKKLRINMAGEPELAVHPYLSGKQATGIVKYRNQHKVITEVTFWHIVILSERDKKRLLPYIDFSI